MDDTELSRRRDGNGLNRNDKHKGRHTGHVFGYPYLTKGFGGTEVTTLENKSKENSNKKAGQNHGDFHSGRLADSIRRDDEQ
ncbi:hypothetical protein KB1_13380 [Cutibacterium modestum]|uniref:Uncharacterized protein n=1 Tax=Cutibacterium modestum TaxID=2559073 RepID=A0AAD1KNW5_9ACTN|nr:hypothetical protein KB1_13380 [Cutibacterium modestum]